MKEIDADSLDAYLSFTMELVESGINGDKILKAAQGGIIKTEAYRREAAPGYDGHVRELIREAVFGVWGAKKRAATLAEIYDGIGTGLNNGDEIEGVSQKIREEMRVGSSPKMRAFPSKRTVDRRTNELASDDRAMWGELDFPPIICLSAGRARANPMFFDDGTREAILRASGEIP